MSNSLTVCKQNLENMQLVNSGQCKQYKDSDLKEVTLHLARLLQSLGFLSNFSPWSFCSSGSNEYVRARVARAISFLLQ